MLETHLSKPGFTYSACGPFTKNKERIRKLKKQETQWWFDYGRSISRNVAYLNILVHDVITYFIIKLGKACFQHDMSYEDFKDLTRRKLIKLIMYYVVKHLLLLKNMKVIKVVLLQWFINFFTRKIQVERYNRK